MASDSTRDVVRAVTRQVVSRLGTSSPEVIEAVVAEVLAATGTAMAPTTIAPSPFAAAALGPRDASDGGPSLASRTTARGSQLTVLSNELPAFDHCFACIEQEKRRSRQRAVLTTTGRNTKGIVARVTSRIADLGGDILDISQTLVGDYFTMILVVDVAQLSCSFERFKGEVEQTVQELGCQAMLMHEDVMSSLHRV